MGVDQLVEFLQSRAGEHHRGTARYDGDDIELLYLREDVSERLVQSQFDRMLQRLKPESTRKEANAFPWGDLHAIVRVFDEAILLHFPTGRHRGVAVALDPTTARKLTAFVRECKRRLTE